MSLLSQIGAVLGIVISLGTVLTVTVPALRNKLKEKLVRQGSMEEELRAIRALLAQQVEQIKAQQKEAELQKEVDLCVLRDLITAIYYRRAKEKSIHSYELEDASALYELYRKRGGNSYVHILFRQMSKEWDVIGERKGG